MPCFTTVMQLVIKPWIPTGVPSANSIAQLQACCTRPFCSGACITCTTNTVSMFNLSFLDAVAEHQ